MNEPKHNLDRQTRNYGIDALRILSMLMIVILHVLKHGGVLDSTETFSVEYRTAWFIQICVFAQ